MPYMPFEAFFQQNILPFSRFINRLSRSSGIKDERRVVGYYFFILIYSFNFSDSSGSSKSKDNGQTAISSPTNAHSSLS